MAKASSVGANTENGPGPDRVSARPAAVTAATRVLKDPALTAVSTMLACSLEVDLTLKLAVFKAEHTLTSTIRARMMTENMLLKLN